MARKPAQRPQTLPLRRGPDNRTAAERLQEAFHEWKARTKGGTQEQLAAQANRIAGFDDEDRERLKQQEISQFLNGESDLANSARASALAEVLGVNPAWLQHGYGLKRSRGELTARQIQALKDLGVRFDEGE